MQQKKVCFSEVLVWTKKLIRFLIRSRRECLRLLLANILQSYLIKRLLISLNSDLQVESMQKVVQQLTQTLHPLVRLFDYAQVNCAQITILKE